MFTLMYSTVMQNSKAKLFIFWPTQKRQNLRNLKIFKFNPVHRLRSEILFIFTQLKIHNILY
jgi:hypothetical protein